MSGRQAYQPTERALGELARTPVMPRCCLLAEIGAALRIAATGGPQTGTAALAADLAGSQQAARLRTAITAAFGYQPAVHVVAGSGGEGKGRGRGGPRYRLVAGTGSEAEHLIRAAGLRDPAGRPLAGMPRPVVAGRGCDCAAGWRGAFLAAGSLCPPERSTPLLTVDCPSRETALALVGTARRIGVAARVRECRGVTQAVVGREKDIVVLLTAIGSPETALEWEALRTLRPTVSEPKRGQDLEGSNLTRSMQAAAESAVRARRALEILGDDAPAHLLDAARLRIAHPDAQLYQLGELAVPPLSKDTIAGRLRRLNVLADARAAQHGCDAARKPKDHSRESDLPGQEKQGNP
jgi:cell division protein WhiA